MGAVAGIERRDCDMYCKDMSEAGEPEVKRILFAFSDDDLRHALRDANDGPLPVTDEELAEIGEGVLDRLEEALDWEFERWAYDAYENIHG